MTGTEPEGYTYEIFTKVPYKFRVTVQSYFGITNAGACVPER